jgi:uncharacterized damage-inducible protein DinB
VDASDILSEAFGRLPAIVRRSVEGLGPDQLTARPAPTANPIAWLVWHLARIQDSHIAELLGQDQVWVRGDWADRFGLVADPFDTGFNHDAHEVAAVRPDGPEALIDYFNAVAERTQSYIATLTAADLDEVIDDSWDPPVTRGARLVSIVSDDLQHAGQANYVRGLLESTAPRR